MHFSSQAGRSGVGGREREREKRDGKYGWVYEPYSGAVMVLMEEVEQRVRSPQHLCGRLMTAEPREGETDRKERETLKRASLGLSD